MRSGKKAKRAIPIQREEKPVENIFEDPFNYARQALYKADKTTFYTEIQRVLWKTVADKCQAPPSGLNKQNITAQLRRCNVPEDMISELHYVLNECEWAVYTPSIDEKDMNKILSSAQRVRRQLVS